jgi:hypothetical protein
MSPVAGKFGQRHSLAVRAARDAPAGSSARVQRQPPSPARLDVEALAAGFEAGGRPRRLEMAKVLDQEVQGGPLVAHQLHGKVAPGRRAPRPPGRCGDVDAKRSSPSAALP